MNVCSNYLHSFCLKTCLWHQDREAFVWQMEIKKPLTSAAALTAIQKDNLSPSKIGSLFCSNKLQTGLEERLIASLACCSISNSPSWCHTKARQILRSCRDKCFLGEKRLHNFTGVWFGRIKQRPTCSAHACGVDVRKVAEDFNLFSASISIHLLHHCAPWLSSVMTSILLMWYIFYTNDCDIPFW